MVTLTLPQILRHNYSLKSRIVHVVVLSVSFFMLAVIGITLHVESELFLSKFENELKIIGDIIGNRSTAALTFNDSAAADRNLRAAHAHPNIDKLCLYTDEGALFGQYIHPDRIEPCTTHAPKQSLSAHTLIGDNFIEITRLVILQDRVVGYITVTANLRDLNSATSYVLSVLLGVFVVIVLLVVLVVMPIIKKALQPLQHLCDTAREVTSNQFTRIRARQYEAEEVGTLVRIFNDMLDRLETENKALLASEAALRRAQKMEAVGQLTGGVAHDFNNILAIILGHIEFLKDQFAGEERALQRVGIIEKSTHRAIKLTQKLLSFSRYQPEVSLVTNINDVIRGMQDLIDRSTTPQIKKTSRLAEDLWLTAVDPGDLEDTLLNLVLNARDAMPNGGELVLQTRNCVLDEVYRTINPTAVPGEYVELTVNDTGTGMSPGIVDHAAEPFFTTKSEGNTGLGLAMVFGFARRSRGHIKFYSEQGLGTAVRVYLPRASEASEHVSPADAGIAPLKKGFGTILVVDDEVALLHLAEEALLTCGYRVLTASDAEQALGVLEEEERVDLLFSDVVMPGGMNGYELAEQAYAKWPQLRVLLASGYTSPTLARNGQSRFEATLISKPYTMRELVLRIQSELTAVPP